MKFQLTIEALHRPSDPNGTRRLRAMLKTLLRAWGFKCIEAKPIEGTTEKPKQ